MKQNVVVPSAGESVNEVYIGLWRKKSGDYVKKDEVLVDIETQKATFELQAEYSGRIEVLKPIQETVVKPGDVIAVIDDSVQMETGDVEAKVTAPDAPAKTVETSPVMLSPAARKLSEEKNSDPSLLKGTGKGGRITKEDVLLNRTQPSASPAAASSPPPVAYQVDTERGEKRQPASRVRRTIAQNLVAAQHTAAILTTFNEVDMTAIMAFRAKHKEEFKKKHGVSLGMVSLFAKACIRALKEYPMVNATFTGDEIMTRDFVDLSVAVSTEGGLVVPVIRDVDKMSLSQIELKVAELSEKAKARKLSIPEMSGGTFTISNGGVFGSLLSTPILNMPQSAILGLHKTQDRPVVINKEVVVRPMMYLALSYDHRIIDGREAVLFLVSVKEGIENLSLIVSDNDL